MELQVKEPPEIEKNPNPPQEAKQGAKGADESEGQGQDMQ